MKGRRDLQQILAVQSGVIERTQLVRAGVPLRSMERWVAAGDWERVQPRVYRPVGWPASTEQRQLAACLSAGAGAVVSHRAAAGLWGVDRLDVGVVEISVPSGRRPRLVDVVAHRVADLAADDVTTLGAIPVTTPARTLVDLGAVSRPWLVHRALVEWTVARRVTLPEVRAALELVARRGRPGVGALRDALDAWQLGDERPDSVQETRFAELLARHGLPTPVYHHLVRVGGEVFELDFAYPDAMLAIEIDGFGPHTGPAAFEEDRRRQNVLGEHGWRILRYTPTVLRSQPERAVSQVSRLLAQRRLPNGGDPAAMLAAG